MQVARCLQAPELSVLSPYLGGRARSAEGVQEGVPGRGEGEAFPFSAAKLRHLFLPYPQSAKECKILFVRR